MWQQSVLLRLVEAMDLIHEEDGLLAVVTLLVFRGYNDLAELRDASKHRAERDEDRVGLVCDHVSEGRLAGSRWAPEDHRRNAIRADRAREDVTVTEKVRLANHVF